MRGEGRNQQLRQGRAAGFTLFETLIVLAIGVAVIGGIMFVMQSQERANRRDAATITMADELANVAKAARQWADTTGEDWTDGSRNVVSIDDLVDNGLLPDDFAARDPDPLVQGVTPAGQRYTIVSIKNGPSGSLYHDPNVDEGKVRTVIWDEGAPNAGRLERIGVQNVAGAILAWKEAVALDTSREHRIPAGVLAVGSGEVRGVGRSFTKDVIDWIEDPVTQPAAVALVGFPDLEGDGGPTTGQPSGGPAYCEDVVFVDEGDGCPFANTPAQCNGAYEEPSCPAGYDELASQHLCASSPTPPNIYGSKYGVVTMGQEGTVRNTPPSMVPYTLCTMSGCSTAYASCGGSSFDERVGYADYNGNTLTRIECMYSYTDSRLTYPGGWGTPPTCSPGSSMLRNYRTLGVAEARSKVCCKKPSSTP